MRALGNTDTTLNRRRFLAASAATGLALSGCGSSDGGSGSGKTTVEWWNITTTEPAKKLWAERARSSRPRTRT